MFGETNGITDAWEGIRFPIPEIVPDETNKKRNQDSGLVVFDFQQWEGFADYLDFGGEFLYNTAFGITKDHLYQCARKYLTLLYDTFDIQLDNPKYVSTNLCTQIVIKYTVNLD